LPIVLDGEVVDRLFKAVEAEQGYQLTVDLEQQAITTPDGESIPFEIDAYRKQRLLEGLDDIGLTLQHADDIRAYEEKQRLQRPWLFNTQQL
jgi:3-isopropylmalate/(R)-2-methylmalate dehydratase small subunit